MSTLDTPPPGHPEQLPPIPGPALPSLRAAKAGPGAWATILGGIAIMLGVLLPWQVSKAAYQGYIDGSWNGLNHPDGGIFFLIGMVVIGWGAIRMSHAVPVGWQYAGVVPGAGAVFFGYVDYTMMLAWANTPQGGFQLFVGPGIGAIILGSAAVFVGALLISREPTSGEWRAVAR